MTHAYATQLDTDEPAVAKLLAVLRLRDVGLADHGQRTAEVAAAIGGEMECDIDTLDRIFLAGQLHDIGKLGVAEATLWKPAGLSHAEWREIRTHPEEGHRLVADVVHRDVAAAVLYHHERADGNGYPYGIDGRSVPLVARIIQVADAFDAMTSGRPYQPAVSTEIAVEEIRRCAASQFDPEVADAIRRVFPPGTEDAPPERESELGEGDRIGPRDPAPADPFATSPSMIRLRR